MGSSSFNLTPWVLIFEPQNKIISQTVTFKYQSDKDSHDSKVQRPSPKDDQNAPVPVEVTLTARELDLDGKVIYPSSQGADDFVVYPSQFILYPGDVKKVQVQWVGAKLPDREISMGFISTQLPLKFDGNLEEPKTAITMVEMMTRYEGIIVVRPPNIKPGVVVDTAYSRQDSAGTHMVVILNNKGTGMQSLKNIDFTVAPLDKNGKIKFNERIEFKNKTVSNATNQSLLAGFRRKVEVPWPGGFPVGPINVSATFIDTPK